MLSAAWPGCVDLRRLPEQGPLRNLDHAVVDGETFDGAPTPDRTVREECDPRVHTDPAWGARQLEQAAREVLQELVARWGVEVCLTPDTGVSVPKEGS